MICRILRNKHNTSTVYVEIYFKYFISITHNTYCILPKMRATAISSSHHNNTVPTAAFVVSKVAVSNTTRYHGSRYYRHHRIAIPSPHHHRMVAVSNTLRHHEHQHFTSIASHYQCRRHRSSPVVISHRHQFVTIASAQCLVSLREEYSGEQPAEQSPSSLSRFTFVEQWSWTSMAEAIGDRTYRTSTDYRRQMLPKIRIGFQTASRSRLIPNSHAMLQIFPLPGFPGREYRPAS